MFTIKSCFLLVLSICSVLQVTNGFFVAPITHSCPRRVAHDCAIEAARVTEQAPSKSKRIRNLFRRVFRRKTRAPITVTDFPVQGRKYRQALKQPQPQDKELELSDKYGAIDCLEERAYQICVDLGLVKASKK